MTPTPGLHVCYRFVTPDSYRIEREMVVVSVDHDAALVETDQGPLPLPDWDRMVRRKMIVPMPNFGSSAQR